MASSILLVDDEETFTRSLCFALEREGYLVRTAGDGITALRLAVEQAPDLVLLDVMLPNADGIEVCRRLRAGSDVPIIMLTARDDEVDKILGLELGADDYVTKPFSLSELLARVRAVLRRAEMRERPAERPAVLISGDVRMDSARHQVQVRGEAVDLSPKEYQLLRVLMQHRGQVVSREFLIDAVWGDDFMGDEKTLDVHIRWLRGKIERNPSEPRHILTVRGAGYLFE
jgi:two-component system, OmpR family, response regulator RegX3